MQPPWSSRDTQVTNTRISGSVTQMQSKQRDFWKPINGEEEKKKKSRPKKSFCCFDSHRWLCHFDTNVTKSFDGNGFPSVTDNFHPFL